MSTFKIISSEALDDGFESPQRDNAPRQNESTVINVLSTVQRLLNIYYGRRDSQQRKKLERFVDVLKSLNSTLDDLTDHTNDLTIQNNYTQSFNLRNSSDQTIETWTPQLVINAYAIPVMAIIGFVISNFGIYYLSSGPRRGKLYNLLLSTLFLCDSMFLMFEFLRGIKYHIKFTFSKDFELYQTIVTSGIMCFLISSNLMLAALSHSRLRAIRKPFKYNSSMLPYKERHQIWGKYCGVVFITSIILTLPILLQFEFSIEDDTKSNRVMEFSSLQLNIIYSILYIGVLNLAILGIIPALLIFFANQIRNELQKNSEFRAHFSAQQDHHKGSLKEIKTSKPLIIGIIVFVTVHAIRIATTFGEFWTLSNSNKDDEKINSNDGVPSWISIIASLSELCLVIYSSMRVLIHLHPYWNRPPRLDPPPYKRHSTKGTYVRKEQIPLKDTAKNFERQYANITILITGDAINDNDDESIEDKPYDEDKNYLGVRDFVNIATMTKRSEYIPKSARILGIP